ncbi:hypothetical protein K431DRAFT_280558 [Polychaeton citri CBS 116435]|uniref:SET domain-containing protein n=1 Tax=Polychaeton citri CBS 116435 TaxID=1314669 RepID=A0A9P4URN7_9PEZI|nr:hypothetical protein K431DRAFT_280558 [Polychaeton citri CBS 116435]
MESLFPLQAYQPSAPSPYPLKPQTIEFWFDALAMLTRALTAYPYDPTIWAQRSKVLHSLQYPELAIGDAWKARSLCRQLLSTLVGKRRGRQALGFGCGFWMLDECDEGADIDEKRGSDGELWAIVDYFRIVERESSTFMQTFLREDEGRPQYEVSYLPRLYPWIPEKWRQRSDEVVRCVDNEMDALTAGCCGIRRHAFGIDLDDDGRSCSADVLGVFAKQQIREGEMVLVDRTALWGCLDTPLKDGSWEGCDVASHPGWGRIDEGGSPKGGGLLWVRQRCGVESASVVVLVKALLQCCISTTQESSVTSTTASESTDDLGLHPLNHPILSRLTASYRSRVLRERTFNIEHDIASPYYALQRHGRVDIFADHRFDTWVLLTVAARLENNATSSLGVSAVFPVFSLFNHDCNPNIFWRASYDTASDGLQNDHDEVYMVAARDIESGEHLCVCYNTYIDNDPLEKRQEMLKQWIEGACQCRTCIAERLQKAEGLASSQDGRRAMWDVDERPVLPEDRGDSLALSNHVRQ